MSWAEQEIKCQQTWAGSPISSLICNMILDEACCLCDLLPTSVANGPYPWPNSPWSVVHCRCTKSGLLSTMRYLIPWRCFISCGQIYSLVSIMVVPVCCPVPKHSASTGVQKEEASTSLMSHPWGEQPSTAAEGLLDGVPPGGFPIPKDNHFRLSPNASAVFNILSISQLFLFL